MRSLILILMASALVVLAGCEKKTKEPVQPAAYDTQTDAPRSIAQTPADPNILEDQAKLSKKFTPPAAPAPVTSAPATPPAESPTAAPAASVPAAPAAAPAEAP